MSGPAGGRDGWGPEVRAVFWSHRMAGCSLADAAAAAGVDERTGKRWVQAAGGVRPRLVPLSGRYLTLEERETIALGRAEGLSMSAIARSLGRSTSTVSRELARNGRPHRRYRAGWADRQARFRRVRPKPAKLRVNLPLRQYVQGKLTAEQWSPEQISRTLPLVFPDQPGMRVSHETIYQSLYVQSRGALKREITACLRTGRAARRPQRAGDLRRTRVPRELLISQRPAEADDRAVPGHWEGDLIIGAFSRSAIGTLVERASRFVMLLHLPDGHGAQDVEQALRNTINTLPAALRRSLTWDQGVELARHAEFTLATDMAVYFCDPHSPWQRGTNENTNGLLRQYFAKGTDLRVHDPAYLRDIAHRLNTRPRKTLNWKTPQQALNEHLVATTG